MKIKLKTTTTMTTSVLGKRHEKQKQNKSHQQLQKATTRNDKTLNDNISTTYKTKITAKGHET